MSTAVRGSELLAAPNQSPDLHQARLRVGVLAFCVLYVWIAETFGNQSFTWHTALFNVCALAYTVFAFEMLRHFGRRPAFHGVRRTLAVLADQGAAFIALATTGTGGLALFWLPLFITQGVGVRFGTRWLIFSQTVGLICVLGAIAMNDALRTNPSVALGLVLATLVLPIYFLALTVREGRVKRELETARSAAEDARAVAERANEAKSAFLATMTHELRSPLMGIVGINEVMATRPHSPDEMQLLHEQRDAALLMLSAVNDILDSSKIEAGEMQAERVEFDVDTTVIQISRALAYAARRKSLALRTQISFDAPCEIVGSPVYLTRIVQNLVSNAIKFTSSGGVVVRLSRGPRSSTTQTWLRLEVEDTGIGIPHEALSRIFDRFYQVDASVTRKFGGTGLGTTIVKQFVDLLGGAIDVRSEPGRGSCFVVDLPIESRTPDKTMSSRGKHHRVGVIVVGADADLFKSFGEACLAEAVSLVQATDAVAAWNAKRALERSGVRHVIFAAAADESFEDTADELSEEIGQPPTWILIEPMGHRGVPIGHIASPRVISVQRDAAGNFESTALALAMNAAARVQRVELLDTDGGPAVGEHGANAGHGVRILVADDTRINQIVFERLLTPRGYELTCANDGAAALKHLASAHYDLAIVDWNMPEVDGLEVVRRVRAGEALNRDVPIVVATAAASRDVFNGAMGAGANEVIGKPFFGRELFAVIERLVPRKSAPERAAAAARMIPAINAIEIVDFAHLDAPHSLFQGSGVERLIETFAHDARGNLALLEEALRDQTLAPLRRGVHNLKGFAGVYGAVGLDRLLDDAPITDEALRDAGKAWLDKMRQTIEATIACLDEWQARRVGATTREEH